MKMQMKNQVGITVILASLILLGFVGCKKKDNDPDPHVIFKTIPNVTLKFYANEADWLNDKNSVKSGKSDANGDFIFDPVPPEGNYYFSVHSDDFLYHNDIPGGYTAHEFPVYDGQKSYSSLVSGPSEYYDPFKYRYSFLGDSVETNWKIDESSNGGLHNSICVSQRKLKINRNYGFEITENGSCVSPSSYDYSISFGEDPYTTWAQTEITTFDIIHTGTTTGLYTLEVLEKVGGIATKIKLMQKATPANYEIYIKQ